MPKKTTIPAKEVIDFLDTKLKRSDAGQIITFEQFLDQAAKEPFKVFRNVFQLFHDMIYNYTRFEDAYKDDPQNINYKTINCDNLLVHGADIPFFADLPLANRLVKLADSFKEGSKQNKLYIFSGPPGSGKSTFINNLLSKLQEYTMSNDGQYYEIFWRIDISRFGPSLSSEIKSALESYYTKFDTVPVQKKDFLEVSCPNHDFPFLIIPKDLRKSVLEKLISGQQKIKIVNKKEFSWLFKNNCCTICNSIYNALSSRMDSPSEVYDMIYAKRFVFDRSVANGISIFNPGDENPKQNISTNVEVQKGLGSLFRDSNLVKYIFSKYSHTNNGVYVIMDLKGNNKNRVLDLHGIISEGTHKIEDIEENINSLFIAVMNPEDEKIITSHESFKDRIEEIEVNYVLNYTEEVKIYFNSFGSQIKKKFLPGVLENFAKIIISTRLNPPSATLKDWIKDPKKYSKYCDENLFLLKLAIYNNKIPNWLSDEDYSRFDKAVRKKIIKESDTEGRKGFSGRESIKIFNTFYSDIKKKQGDQTILINMEDVRQFFLKKEEYRKKISVEFINSIVHLYNYNLMEQIKVCLFHQNEDRISKDIQNYLCATTYDIGERITCPYTNETFEITQNFFDMMEHNLTKKNSSKTEKEKLRKDIASRFTISLQELNVSESGLTTTAIYKELYNTYIKNLRENIFQPFIEYKSFENAIKEFGTEKFEVFDNKTKDEVKFLLKNLVDKFHYTQEGAQSVCLYALKNNIASEFMS